MDRPSTSPETELSFERTYGGANRTLAAALRTASSLVGMGLVLFQIFSSGLRLDSPVIEGWARLGGASLVLMGEGLLIAAVLQHERLRRDLRQRHAHLHARGLMGPPPDLPAPSVRVLALAVIVGSFLGLLVLALLGVRA